MSPTRTTIRLLIAGRRMTSFAGSGPRAQPGGVIDDREKGHAAHTSRPSHRRARSARTHPGAGSAVRLQPQVGGASAHGCRRWSSTNARQLYRTNLPNQALVHVPSFTIAASHRGDRRRHHRRQAPVFAVEVALSGEERPAAVDGRRLPTIGLSAFGGVVDRWWLESFIGLWSSSFFIGLLVLRGCSSPRLIAFGASSALSLVDLLDLQMRLSAV